MNKDQQRIAIAEACGWRFITDHDKHQRSGLFGIPPNEEANEHNLKCVPDYLNDLNAMHEAEGTIKKSPLLWGQYRNTLALFCGGTMEDDGGQFVNHQEAIDATAAQRAEAFLRTIGKWEEK